MKLVLLMLLFVFSVSKVGSQDSLKALDHDDFLIWKTIHDPQLSPDGMIVTYRLVPGEGDPQLVIYSKKDSTYYPISRVSRSNIDYDGKFIYGLITPFRDSLRMLERKKVEKKDWPSDTLFIYNIETRQIDRIPFATNYKSPEKFGGWLAYTLKKQAFDADSIKPDKKNKKEIVHLLVRKLTTGQQDTLKFVKEFTWSEKSPSLLAVVDTKDSTLTSGVFYYKDHQWKNVKKQKGEYAKLSLSPDGSKISFAANHDTTKALVPPWQLYFFNFQSDSAFVIAQGDQSKLPLVSQHADLRWSDDNRYLYYGRAEMPFVKDTTLLEDESVNVEIWRTEDPVLYTVQNVNKPNEEKRSYTYVYDTQTAKHVAINSPEWESSVFTREKNNRFVLVYTDKPYQLGVTWLGEAAKDLAVVDIQTGKVTPFKKEIYTSPRLSPGGKYAYGYSDVDTSWWTYHIITGVFSFMNAKGLPSFFDELNDIPGLPNSYGSAGWTTGDEDFILYDRYDVWKWSPLKSKTQTRLTKGREAKHIYRYIHTDPEKDMISSTDPWLMHVTDDATKSSGYAWYSPVAMTSDRPTLIPYQHSKQVTKARMAETYLFKKRKLHYVSRSRNQ